MPNTEELRRAFDRAVYGAERRTWVPGRLGMVNADTTVSIDVSDRRGWVYVTYGPIGTHTVSVARNDAKVPRRAYLPVKLRRADDGALVVWGINNEGGLADTGMTDDPDNPSGITRHHHRIGSGLEYESQALLFEPGRIYGTGGMIVHITPFRYVRDGVWKTWEGGDLDLTAYKPATVNEWAWVIVGIDPATNTAVAATGDDVPYATALAYADLDSVVWGDYIPCGAVKVRYDATDLTDIALYSDAHAWFHADKFPLALDDLSDVVIVTPADNEMLAYDVTTSKWINQTAAEAGLDALYLVLAGQSGGQTAYGGTGSGDDLTLNSTSHATKGSVNLATDGGYVGIGTATPTRALDVIGAISASDSIVIGENLYMLNDKAFKMQDVGGGAREVMRMSPDDDLIIGYGVQAGNYVGFAPGTQYGGGGMRMVVMADGKVGIGTTSPDYLLTVNGGSIRLTGNIALENNQNLGAKKAGGSVTALISMSPDDSVWIYSEKMVITDTGNVGIGTITPTAPLQVVGNMYSTGALGWYYSKTGVAHNTATAIATATLSVGAGTYSSFLIAINLTGTSRVASKVFTVSTAWSTENVYQISEALFGYTALNLTAAMDTTTRVLTLTVTQTNPASEAAAVHITIQPLIIGSAATHTAAFAGL